MLTYEHFLIEKFLKGFDADFGYSEIYKNPTRVEWTQVGHKQSPGMYLRDAYGAVCYYAGAILTTKDIYVFNRENAEHHTTAYAIPKLESNWFPLYCYFFFAANVLAISPSSFSFSPEDMKKFERSKSNHADDNIMKRRVKGHPQLKKFARVVDTDGGIIKI